MEITLFRLIILKENAHQSRNVTKSFNSEVIPRNGDFIVSTAFERDEEVKVTGISIDYEQNQCTVYLEPLSINSEDIKHLKQIVDMYMLHDWQCSYYGFE
jgi:hypothetical protein